MRKTLFFPIDFWEELNKRANELEMKPAQYIRLIIKRYWKEEKNEKKK